MSHPRPDHVLLSQSFDEGHVSMLRRFVAKHAAEVDLPESRRQDFVLAVDEVVTNAVRHGGGHGHLDVWIADGLLWFRVTDRGAGIAAPLPTRAPAPTVLGGRGLWITRQVTDDMTIATGPFGTTVTAAVSLPRARP